MSEHGFLPAEAWPSIIQARSANVDIVDMCNLRCPECARGTRAIPNSKGRMDFGLFTEICRKFRSEKIDSINLYNWTEPFFHPDIAAFVGHAAAEGFAIHISSNLSLAKMETLLPTLEAGLTTLFVSISGYTNDVHQRYHVGSDIQTVFRNLRNISKDGRFGHRVCIKYLGFPYNISQLPEVAKLCREYGIQFELIQAHGAPESFDNTVQKQSTSFPSCTQFLDSPGRDFQYFAFHPEKVGKNYGKLCRIAVENSLDYRGDLYLCCDRPTYASFRLGHYLDLDPGEILLRKYVHPECANCSNSIFLPLSAVQKRVLGRLLL